MGLAIEIHSVEEKKTERDVMLEMIYYVLEEEKYI